MDDCQQQIFMSVTENNIILQNGKLLIGHNKSSMTISKL